MSQLKRNLVANYLGQGWTAVIGLAFVPFYIKLMGIEAYGLLGFMVTIQAVMFLLDLGLSQSLNREMARLSVRPDSEVQLTNTVRTLEVIYWGMAAVVFLILAFSSRFIANHWLSAEKLSSEEIVDALRMMAALIAVRWPIAIYSGGLNGLQCQVLLNAISAITATLQGGGAVLVLIYIQPTIHAFLIWQLIVSVINVLVMRYALWRSLPRNISGAFTKDIVLGLWRFAAGMMAITLTSVLLMQTDKILLSKLLSLEVFGYYTFASAVGSIVGRVIAPILTAYYPKITSFVAANDQQGLIKIYHQGCQILSVVVLPVSLILIFFSNEILTIWTQNETLASQSALLLSLLVIGNTLNGLMTLPYLLQLAHGWTRLAMYTNSLLVLLAIPLIYVATSYWGANGAASIWVAINATYILFSIHLIHRRLLVTEKWSWYKNDLGKILISALIVVVCGKFVMFSVSGVMSQLIVIFVTGFLALFAALYSAESIKGYLKIGGDPYESMACHFDCINTDSAHINETKNAP